MPHERNWLAALQCLFADIPDARHDGQPAAVVPATIRSWKEDMPHAIANEWRTFEGENEAAGLYALRDTLIACAEAIGAGRALAATALPTATELVSVLRTAKPFHVVHNKWVLCPEAVHSPLSDSVGVQLASYRPARDIDGNSLPYADWDRWYRSVDSRVLSQMFNNRMDPRASQAAIFATIQWMYYALWRKRITFAQMPTHYDLKKSIRDKEVLTFGATPGEIGWANEVGVDMGWTFVVRGWRKADLVCSQVAFLDRHLLHRKGAIWQAHNHPPAFLEPAPELQASQAPHTTLDRSLLKPRLGYRMRRIYKMDV